MALIEHDLKKQSGELQRLLNEQLANLAVAYVKLHHFHWYVKGMHFQVMHEKFEELYNAVTQMMDELAERMLAIGLRPASTMKDYLSLTKLHEGGAGDESAEQMLQMVSSDFKQMIQVLQLAVAHAEEKENDAVTADLLNGHIKTLQKQVWMLNASIGK